LEIDEYKTIQTELISLEGPPKPYSTDQYIISLINLLLCIFIYSISIYQYIFCDKHIYLYI